MRRRKLLLMLACLAIVSCAVGAFVLWPPPYQVTQENYDRLKVGMLRADVEAIIGPPGFYRNGPAVSPAFVATKLSDDDPNLAGFNLWWGDTVIVCVSYDHSGRVIALDHAEAIEPKVGLLGWFRWHANRQWHRWFPE
jgi:hypothetical protein